MTRLTRKALQGYIVEQLATLRLAGLVFDPRKDERQVLGCSLNAHWGYGQFRALRDLAREFGIDPDKETPTPRKKRPKDKPGTLASDLKILRGFGQTEGYMKAIREGRGR